MKNRQNVAQSDRKVCIPYGPVSVLPAPDSSMLNPALHKLLTCSADPDGSIAKSDGSSAGLNIFSFQLSAQQFTAGASVLIRIFGGLFLFLLTIIISF